MANIVQENNYGDLVVSDEVLGVIANIATKNIDGVAALSGGNLGTDFTEMLGMKNTTKGIKVIVEETNIKAEVYIEVFYGFKVNEVALQVQKSVKESIESMTGLMVADVNVYVTGIRLKKEEIAKIEQEEV